LTNIFYLGLKIYGKDWKRVENFIGSRSGAQIRSHAQKFFIQIERTKGMDLDEYIKKLQNESPEFEKKRDMKKSIDSTREI
jgi:SHAQKYF class myb-like DNA-binding protein